MTLRSFCGGVLHGDKLVRLVYMDEAGLSSPTQEPFVVVAGIIVHGDHQLNGVHERLDRIRERHIPVEHRNGFVFHATQLFNGGGKVFNRNNSDFPLKKRLEIADELAAIPKELHLPIALGSVKRDGFEFPPTLSYREKTVYAHAYAFYLCSISIEKWMRKHKKNENCLLIVEDNQSARDLIRKVQNANQDKSFVIYDWEREFFPLKQIREDPLFQPKKPCNPLEIADFCAYVFKRFLMNHADERYLRFFNPLRGQVVPWNGSPLS